MDPPSTSRNLDVRQTIFTLPSLSTAASARSSLRAAAAAGTRTPREADGDGEEETSQLLGRVEIAGDLERAVSGYGSVGAVRPSRVEDQPAGGGGESLVVLCARSARRPTRIEPAKYPSTSTTWAKARYYIPSLYWIPHYSIHL
ncbi:hypothetical protein BV25DRAFT_1818965 [Artomyces pyxidatus]|uniref:Uncharacterized protein n=1 Tax=Artomyces pyxidatus TaxID=48021 RepID=A0ACB8TGM0_9AGAM|nr:hypothetical protein BV25DRAFT_1818965 [Artomyces pyxidatus]